MMNDQRLIQAVIRQESGGNANALSPKGAAGIMQIMPDTARDPGYGVTPLQNWDGVDPRSAPVDEQIRFGTDYMNAMSRINGGDTNLALAAYNAGPGAVIKYGGVPPYQETQNYVQKVNSNMAQPAEVTPQTSDWRSRAVPVQADAPVQTAQSDWRSRAQPIQNAAPKSQSDWRSRAKPADAGFVGGLGQAYAARNKQMQDSADAYVAGDQTMGETVVQQGLANASKLTDTVGHVVGAIPLVGPALQAVGGAAVKGASNLPVGFGGTGTMGEATGQIMEQNPRLARNLNAAGEAVGLATLPKAVDIGAQLASKGGSVLKNAEGSGTSFKPSTKATQATNAAEMKDLAGQSYDEAAYLGAKFTPEQVSNKIGQELNNLAPKPIAGTVLTSEDKVLANHLKEFQGVTGKDLTLDDIKRLDESIGQKITSNFIDAKTGLPDANGRRLMQLQTKVRRIVDDVDSPGNDALVNGRNFWRAQVMMNDLDTIAERASMSRNVGDALQNGYKSLAMDKDRIAGWPQEAKDLLKKAATPGLTDEAIGLITSRLPAIIMGGTGNLAGAATAQVVGAAGRGAKAAMIAGRGAKIQQAIVDNAMSKARPVNIPAPVADLPLQLAAPGKLSALPMSDAEIAIAKAKNAGTSNASPSGIDLSGGAITPQATLDQLPARLLAGPGKEMVVDSKGTARPMSVGEQLAAGEARGTAANLGSLTSDVRKAISKAALREKYGEIWDSIDAANQTRIQSEIAQAYKSTQRPIQDIINEKYQAIKDVADATQSPQPAMANALKNAKPVKRSK